MGFLLLAFYPPVWSALKFSVLCCCNQRRSKDSPDSFPWGYLAWDLSREREPLNAMWLYASRDEQAASRIQSSGWGRHPCPVHCSFSNMHTHTLGWQMLSYTDSGFFFFPQKKSLEKKLLSIDSIMDLIIYPLANWPRKMAMSACSKGFAPVKQSEMARSLFETTVDTK